MHLLRVQIPEYRGLKNIDLTFEKDFKPRIFPLGSQNGGGKSTLLQLIFALLHCSWVKIAYLENMLKELRVPYEAYQHPLATFDIWYNDQTFQIEFLVCNDDYLKKELNIKDKFDPEKFPDYEKKENLFYITRFSSRDMLFSRVNNMTNMEESGIFLEDLAKKVFLTAPSTQVYLFLPQEARKILFKKDSSAKQSYYEYLNQAKAELPGFFTYDFIAIDAIIDFFKMARDSDFAEMIKAGEYGNSYKTLSNDLNTILGVGTKRIKLEPDLSGVTFEMEQGKETINLYPEDLSHGELSKLSIYAWLKSRQIVDAIVLFDEIETAFHPDWEYQIVSDLQRWEPNNQYILATHSYELCQALTPAHVKELEPKLLKPAN